MGCAASKMPESTKPAVPVDQATLDRMLKGPGKKQMARPEHTMVAGDQERRAEAKTGVRDLFGIQNEKKDTHEVLFPPDEARLPPIQPGQGGQHNKQLGIVAGGKYRQGIRDKDEDRIIVHADWLALRRFEAARLLSEGKELPKHLSEAELRLLLPGSDGSAAGSLDEPVERVDASLKEGEPLGSRVGVFAVLDGHGGDQVSDRLRLRMAGALVRALSAPTPEDAADAHKHYEDAIRAREEAEKDAAESPDDGAAVVAEAGTPSTAAGEDGASGAAAAESSRPRSALLPPVPSLPSWATPPDTSRQHLTRMAGSPAGPKVTFNPPVSATARRCVTGESLRDRLRWFCRAMDKWVMAEATSLKARGGEDKTQAGTCLAAATVVGDSLVVFNVGDCEAVLSVKGRPVLLTAAHKATVPSEVARIRAAGRRVVKYNGVWRTEGVLAVTRSVGVTSLKQRFPGAVIPDPYVRVVQLSGEEEFLVMGSDGLFDKFPMHADLIYTAKRFLRETKSAMETANRLLAEAIDVRNSGDNACCVVVVFNQDGPPVDPATGRPRRTAECWGWGRGVGYAAKASGRPAIPGRRARAGSAAGSRRGPSGDAAAPGGRRGPSGDIETASSAGQGAAAVAVPAPAEHVGGGDDGDASRAASHRTDTWGAQSHSGSMSPEAAGLSFATEHDALKRQRRQGSWRKHSGDGDDTAVGDVGEDGEDLSAAADAALEAAASDAGSEAGSAGDASARSGAGVVPRLDLGAAGSGPAKEPRTDQGRGEASPGPAALGRRLSSPGAGAASAVTPRHQRQADEGHGVAMGGRSRRATVDSRRGLSKMVLRTQVARAAAEAGRLRATSGWDVDPAAEGIGEGAPEPQPEDV